MTAPNLDWLVEGATVAYIVRRHRQSDRVYPAHVDKIGKRDVAITFGTQNTKFNINHTQESGANLWLYRRPETWDPGTYLAPIDDPEVAEIGERQMRERAADKVMKNANEFGKSHEIAAARQLRDAIDEFLKLADTQPR